MKHLIKVLRLLFFFPVFSGLPEKGIAAVLDTVVIAVSEQQVRIDRAHPAVVMPLHIVHQQSAGSPYILFEGMVLKKAPEGIYEVYLRDSVPNVPGLKDTSPFFVHTLNTYYLSDQGSHHQLMNAGRQQNFIQQTKNKNGPYYLIVIFRGNKFVDGKRSVDAGELTIRSASLIHL